MCRSYPYMDATRVRCWETIVFHCKTLCKTSVAWKIRARRQNIIKNIKSSFFFIWTTSYTYFPHQGRLTQRLTMKNNCFWTSYTCGLGMRRHFRILIRFAHVEKKIVALSLCFYIYIRIYVRLVVVEHSQKATKSSNPPKNPKLTIPLLKIYCVLSRCYWARLGCTKMSASSQT